MIEIPGNVHLIEWPASTLWFDENGILHSVYKKGVTRTLEDTKKMVHDFKLLTNGKKVCMLIDVTYSAPSSREIRNYVASELPNFAKAIAMVSTSAVGKMLANIFFTLRSQPYPTKVFNDEEEAKEWLKQYL